MSYKNRCTSVAGGSYGDIRMIDGSNDITIDAGALRGITGTNVSIGTSFDKPKANISELPWSFKDSPESIRSNRDIIEIVVKDDPVNYQYITDELKADKDLAMEVCDYVSDILIHVHDDLKDDPDLLKKVLSKHGVDSIGHAGTVTDKYLAIELLQIDPQIIKYIYEDLKADPDVILTMLDPSYRIDVERLKGIKSARS